MKKLNLFFLLLTLSFSILAQDNGGRKTSFSIGTQYKSNMQYLGRKDSVNTPLIVPNTRLSLKNGIYAEGEGYFNLNNGRIDGGYFALGYEFSFSDNFGGGIGASKYFFDTHTDLVNATISTSVDAYLYYDAKILTLNTEASYNFGDANDFVLGTGISKEIEAENIFKNTNLRFSPKLYSWFGSQNFFVDHFKTIRTVGRRNPRRGNSGSTTGGTTTITVTKTTEVQKFQLMSIEFNAPLDLVVHKKWKFTAEPAIAFAQNLVDLGGYYTTANQPKTIFIMNAGLTYTF